MLKLEGYTLTEVLHEGKKFNVYRAVRESDRQKVMLKVCRFEQPSLHELASLQHEYEILKQLNLNGVVRVYDLIQRQQQLILVLEEIEGQPLRKFLSGNPLSLNAFFKIALQLVDTLGALHLQHIIHKDINANNIIINASSLMVKLADFSISTQLSQETQESIQRRNLEGTLAYISPEQTGRMNRSMDYRTDFYSLGVTFYEMLTGQLPFSSDDALELIHHHLAKIPDPVYRKNPQIPEMMSAIIDKLLAKIPENRYASAAGLKADLIECQLQWQTQQEIEPFQLGQKDVYDHLIISQKLYGREEQVKQLLATFERVNKGSKEILLISGYSGIGKTSLVKEINLPITRDRGYFVSGKYDQLQRTTPYSAVIEAFQELVRRLLAEPEKRLQKIKLELLEALGNNGQVIIDVIPNVALIIGPQPAVAELAPAEAQNRFSLTLQSFIRALAQAEHPLVLFLDDLQWADIASLQLINVLTTDAELTHFFLIGAYRDNEVSAEHPLTIALRQIEKTGISINQLSLPPLTKQDVQYLLAESFNNEFDKVEPLARLLIEKTDGNPFFINEFLKLLHQQKLLTFSYDKRCWEWNIELIRQQAITDNVVDLLTVRIHQLPQATQKLLQLAACIGHTFDLVTLSIISEQSIAQTLQQLWEAININLIMPLDGSDKTAALLANINVSNTTHREAVRYKFLHDRIQQAAYQLIPKELQQQVHLKIGRLLLQGKTLEENDERLFEIVNHFFASFSLINDPHERNQLAEYFYWAGNKAKASTAYAAAKAYLQAGVDLLSQQDWKNSIRLMLSLYKELAVCQYLTGEFEKAEINFQTLLNNARDALDKMEFYQLNCAMLATLNKHNEAIKIGLEALKLVDIHLPKKPNTFHILRAIIKIKSKTRWKKSHEIKLFPITNSEYRAAANLISQLLNSAFITDQKLFVLLACINVDLSLKHGYTDSTTFSFVVYAFSIMHALNWYSESMNFIDLYNRLAQLHESKLLVGRNYFVLGAFIDPWSLSLNSCLDNLSKGYQYTYEVGDLVYTNYCSLLLVLTAFMFGLPMNNIEKYIEGSSTFVAKAKTNDFVTLAHFWKFVFHSLKKYPFDLAKLRHFEQQVLANKNLTEISFFYSESCKFCYLLGLYKEAEEFGEKFLQYDEYCLGMVSYPEGQFYYVLALIAQAKNKKSLPKKQLKFIKKFSGRMQRWTNWCKPNFNHYLLLLEAELARLDNNRLLAIDRYKEAIQSAQERHVTHFVGLANECACRFYLNIQLADFAKVHATSAYYSYQSWGATAKCKLLEQEYPQWLHISSALALEKDTSTTTSDSTLAAIDVLSILKSTQAISGEIRLDKLLQKLLFVLLQNAGAQRGMLLIRKDDHWYVEAEGTINVQKVQLSQAETMETRTDLPLSLINYVQRTNEKLLIQSSQELEPYLLADDYLRQVRPQSILILPILYQSQLRCLLYLENRAASYTFTAAHVQTLQLLASQAAISLENARLYFQATHDPLTGLANRNLLYQMFNHAMARNVRQQDKIIAILFLDIDGFKKINDTLGHEIGDKLLIYFSEQLKLCLRECDLAARLGGDEFIVMLEDLHDASEACVIVERFLQSLNEPAHILEHDIYVSSSIGVSVYPHDGNDIQTLLKQADIALYRAKDTSKGNYQFYTASLNQQLKEENEREIELRQALEKDELCLYYQPVFSAKDHKLLYYEALARWQHPRRGFLAAGEFIPLAEKTGLILPLGEWVLRAACQQIKAWQEANIAPVPIAINVSGFQFRKIQMSALVNKVLQETNVNPKYLELEFTESIFIEHTEKILADIEALRNLTVRLTIDDFGTYYSSLLYLRRFPVDKIKIDQAFVKDIISDESNRTLILSIIAMAHSLKLQVVAEGVETPEQLTFLEENGADAIQGFYLGRPYGSDVATKLLQE